jgi:hypothetical protein
LYPFPITGYNTHSWNISQITKKSCDVDDPFWKSEADKWDGLFDEHYVALDDTSYQVGGVPERVEKAIISNQILVQ